MKKLILKTILVTLGVTLILAISVFGIVSVSAPYAMMRLTASLGLDVISGDYAYQEYERSGDMSCLARSFLIAAEHRNNNSAEERFEALHESETFSSFCEGQEDIVVKNSKGQEISRVGYSDYLLGKAACVKYRLADGDAAHAETIAFALDNTGTNFPEGNPAAALAAEAASARDGAFCTALLSALQAASFEENPYYLSVINILENILEEHS